MPTDDARIDHFRKMTEADPDNELGHFSLGRAYMDASQPADAAKSFERVIAINPNMSKAYELLAAALLQQGKRPQAIQRLTEGVKVAHARGDMMPKQNMLKTLNDLGAPAPELPKSEHDRPLGEGEVLCSRCGRIGQKLPAPPFRNEQGKTIHENVCAPCWREWIGMGTKVINELRLPLNDPQAQKIFDQHMLEFLNLKQS